MQLARFIGRDARIGPMAFFVNGVWLFALKFLVDRLVATLAFGRPWSVYNYLIPIESFPLLSRTPGDARFYSAMLAVALPFVVVGILVTLARLRDAHLPQWLALLFFVPAANLVFFAVLSVVPSAGRKTARPATPDQPPFVAVHEVTSGRLEYGRDELAPLQRLWPRSTTASAFLAVFAPVPFALLVTYLAVNYFRGYGWGVFVGMPFVLGMTSAVLHGLREPRSAAQCTGIAVLSLAASGAGMIALAIEGLGCLIMLAPLAIPVAMMGGALGYSIQARRAGAAAMRRSMMSSVVCLPLMIGGESLNKPAPSVFAVTTSIVIDAPPSVVWQHVVTFRDIPRPTDWMFRAGVAYPVRARIEGAGVGAIRHCEFSTGAFVEPIEVWDEPRLLKFAVTDCPPPMKEWSPFDVHAPHLENVLVARAGQFHLIDLGHGRTRVEGTTWYEHRMWPETYWRWWSDHVVQRIHWRVLEHVKSLAEETASVPSPGIPTEGWGGFFNVARTILMPKNPHPDPLPGYRAREYDARRPDLHFVSSCLRG